MIRVIFASILLLSLWGCGNVPEKTVFPTNVDQPLLQLSKNEAKALWIAGSDYFSTGKLYRLDMATGNLSEPVRVVGTDVHLVPDGSEAFFLLSRSGSDSITRLSGVSALASATYALKDMENPQSAVRDRHGNVWFVRLDSNMVSVLDPNLGTEIDSIDLSDLADSSDGAVAYAEFSDIALVDKDTVAVIGARTGRENGWAPEKQSAFALIDINSKTVKHKGLVDIANGTQILALNRQVGNFALVGSGSLIPIDPSVPESMQTANIQFHLKGASASAEILAKKTRIIHAKVMSDGSIVSIEWDPTSQKSCIRRGFQELVCETQANVYGTVFYRVETIGDLIFVGYSNGQQTQLWIIAKDGSQIQKLPFPLNIVSLVPGP